MPRPEAQIVFYRTSEVYHGQVRFTVPALLETVVVRMWDRGLEEEIWSHDLTQEELSRGEYAFSDYDLFSGDYVEKHLDQLREGYEPDPVLEVIYTFRAETGTETVTEQAEPAYEPWISARYDLQDPSEDFLAYFMEQTTYPDCFVVRIEDTPYGDLHVAYGEEGDLPAGGVAVTITVDGRALPGDDCRLETETFEYEGTTFYTYLLIVPRPEDFPAEGTAQITIARRLLSYPDITRRDIKEVTFGQEQ